MNDLKDDIPEDLIQVSRKKLFELIAMAEKCKLHSEELDKELHNRLALLGSGASQFKWIIDIAITATTRSIRDEKLWRGLRHEAHKAWQRAGMPNWSLIRCEIWGPNGTEVVVGGAVTDE
jgi:hypothetical protein